LRKSWLGDPQPTATPLAALLAAADERLALMPLVGEAKRRAGLPVVDEAQEGRVLDAALRAVHEAAAASGRAQPSDASVRAVFQALIAMARHLESTAIGVSRGALMSELPSLESALRPAISRITPKIAEALVRLESLPPVEELRTTVREGLRTSELGGDDAQRLADALVSYLDAGERGVPSRQDSTAPSKAQPPHHD
jgi:chorismate mutase